ncbi:putative serine protease F56F10.1 [Centruroides sculpturatus]|uniref:putative serine protease F56F10.1 n=1 Tax=Centruroides sculpturatus TaxID=218467 RepID=UPI000C6C898D|nr:putative serine protease F56F10.1 [Centruroides sculpturatus]
MEELSWIMIGYLCFSVVRQVLGGESLFYRGRPRGKFGMLRSLVRNEGESVPEDRWFLQKLDHFNPTDNRVWKQRYFVNASFYKPGGPVFLQIGGEGEANPVWMIKGQPMNYAKTYNAFAVMLEHRYYGKSHPTEDTSVKNLRYLTSEQALADLANFQHYVTRKYNLKGSKWIAFGGSYPGSLAACRAAWYRLKYPHLVHKSVASSAPVFALVDFKEYLGVVTDSLATAGKKCNDAIRLAAQQLSRLLKYSVGRQKVTETFRLCSDWGAANEKDVANLFSNLAGNFKFFVQYNKENTGITDAKGQTVTIDTICGIMEDDAAGSQMERYSRINDLLLDSFGIDCLDVKYDDFIRDLSSTSWNDSAAEGGRQWTYQTCVEFGFFQSSDLSTQPFGNGFPVDFFVRQCSDVFGPEFTLRLLQRGIDRTNLNYGGFGLRVTNVVFPNGSIDPWHALGITRDISPEAIVIYINGTAHCADMYPDSPDDLPQLRAARREIKERIGLWLRGGTGV